MDNSNINIIQEIHVIGPLGLMVWTINKNCDHIVFCFDLDFNNVIYSIISNNLLLCAFAAWEIEEIKYSNGEILKMEEK